LSTGLLSDQSVTRYLPIDDGGSIITNFDTAEETFILSVQSVKHGPIVEVDLTVTEAVWLIECLNGFLAKDEK
jgi:hypothetical protein